MALVSSGGGFLRVPKVKFATVGKPKPMKVPKALKPLKAGQGSYFPVVNKPTAPKTPVVTPVKPAGYNPGVLAGTGPTGDPTTDPFEFIKGLMQTTDPAAIRALVDQVYAPVRQGVNDQIAQMQATSKAQADQMSQVYQAFEQYMSGMPAEIQKIYGQGSSDGSAISNTWMSESGKAWASYAAAQPHIYALMATQNIKQMLNAEHDSEAQLRSKLLDLSSQEASSILSYLQTAQDKDAQLQEWAFQQKQAQGNAAAQQTAAEQRNRQAQLALDQKASEIAWTHMQVAISRGDKLAAADWDRRYKAAQLKEKYDAMNATDRRAAQARDAAAARQQVGIAAQGKRAAAARAATAAGRAATAKAATNKATAASLKAANAGLNKTTQKMGQDIGGKKQKGGQVTNIWLTPDGKTYDHQVWYGGPGKTSDTPVKGYAKVAATKSRGKQYTPQNLWTYAWSTYSRPLFNYYRTLYPNLAKTPGEIQKLVTKRIAAAVGWHP